MAATKKNMMAAAARASGIGESRVFASEKQDSEMADRPVLHVNGEPIPAALAHAIPYLNTDEGIAERLAKPHALAEVTGDEHDRRMLEIDDSAQPWESVDPMKELTDRHIAPGMRAKFLSDKVTSRQGRRGFQPVIDAKTGDPIRLGSMVLAQMPAVKAEARNQHYRDQGNDAMTELNDTAKENQERLMREAGSGLSVLRPGETVRRDLGHSLSDFSVPHLDPAA